MKIEELTVFSEKDFPGFSALMDELDGELAFSADSLRAAVADPAVHLYLAREGDEIAGCASLCVFDALSGRKGSVEDVAVLSPFRGKHIGRSLVEYVISEARRLGLVELQLTSKPHRIAANRLYPSLGFVKTETNCYRLKLKSLPD